MHESPESGIADTDAVGFRHNESILIPVILRMGENFVL
jgi:hypothetical protein